MARQRLSTSKFKEIDYDLKQFPDPSKMDIKRAEIAALTCKSFADFAEVLELEEIVVKVWCKRSEAYRKAINSWEEQATFDIKKALAKRALGFSKTTAKDILTRTGNVVTLETQTYYPPDTAAAQFWLKNRDGENWKDKSEVDMNVTANIRQWLIAAGELDGSNNMLDITNESQSAFINVEPTIKTLPGGESLIEENEINLINNNQNQSLEDFPGGSGLNHPGGNPLNTFNNNIDNEPISSGDGQDGGQVDTSTTKGFASGSSSPAWQAVGAKWGPIKP